MVSHQRQVDENNIIAPSLSVKNGYLTYTWTHLLGDGGVLKTFLDPFKVSNSSNGSSSTNSNNSSSSNGSY